MFVVIGINARSTKTLGRVSCYPVVLGDESGYCCVIMERGS